MVLKKLINELPQQNNLARHPGSDDCGDNMESFLYPDLGENQAGLVTEEGKPYSESSRKRSKTNRPVASNALVQYPAEVTFFQLLHSELQKCIRFYNRMIEEFNLRVSRLDEGFKIMKQPGFILVQDKRSVLARSAFQVYKDLLLLEAYSIMTYCGFSKILKKHDKVTGRNTRFAFMTIMVNQASFNETNRLLQMIQSCENRYHEATSNLEQEGRGYLQDDERLFLSMVAKLNNEVLVDPDSEGGPLRDSIVRRNLISSRKKS